MIANIADIEFEGIDYNDCHDFTDAHIVSASVLENGKWREANEDELDSLNDDSSFVYQQLMNHIY